MSSAPTVAFGDLSYLNKWDHNLPLPLNVGYIAAYLAQKQADVRAEIFKDVRKLLQRIEQSPPDILALSHYDWNANLDLAVLRRAKAIRPDTVAIVGGPNFESDNPEWIHGFFAQRPEIDFFITGEGEGSFHRMVELLRAHDRRPREIPFEDLPASCYSFDHETRSVIHNPLNTVARLDLSTVPSPYLTGLMDSFLDDPQLAPIFETNRGCPYSCTFCCWGQATQSKVNRFPLETVLAEIRYACERSANPSGFMYIADGNFGILPRDLEIAEAIQECTELYGRPKRIFIYFAKNTNGRVLQIADTLSSVTSMSMSKQTLDPQVLSNIKRSNIPVEQYDDLRLECEQRGIDSFCELIYGLPGQSYLSYVDGVISTLRSGQRVTMYPHMMLHGAEGASPEERKRFGIETAFRVIPACISSYPELPSLEYEEVVVATDAMPHEHYLRMRLFQFLYFVLSREMFDELGRGLRHLGLDVATVADLIARDEDAWPPRWREIIELQRWGVENEFLPADQLKLEFTREDMEPVKSDRGLPRLISNSETLQELHNYLRELLRRTYSSEFAADDLNDLLTALDYSFDRIVRFDDPAAERVVFCSHDVDAWLTSDTSRSLNEFRTERQAAYLLKADERLLRLVDDTLKQLGDLPEALFRVRKSMLFGRSGDRLYTYERVPLEGSEAAYLQAQQQRQRRDVQERHSEVAIR